MDATAVDPNVVPSLVAILAHTGDVTRYDEFNERFLTAPTPQEDGGISSRSRHFKPTALLERPLTRTISGEIRTQDAPFPRERDPGQCLWQRIGLGFFGKRTGRRWTKCSPTRAAPHVRRDCQPATPELERDVRDFFTMRKIDLGGKTLDQYLEQLRIAVTVRERDSRALRSYLDGYR